MSLSELFAKDKHSLLKQMEMQAAFGGVIGVVNSYLASITDLQGSYISALTRAQARIALSIIRTQQEQFRQLADQIDCLTRILSEQTDRLNSSHPQTKNSYPIPDSNTLAGIGASTVVAAFLPNPLLAIPIASLVGILATTLSSTKRSPASPPHDENSLSATQRGHLQLECNAFLSYIEQLFQTVDEVLDEHNRLVEASRPQPIVPKLEDHARILEFLQDLLGWYQRNKDKLPNVIANSLEVRFEEQLPDLFSEYKIQVCSFPAEGVGNKLDFFEFEDEVGEPRLTMPVMIRPALLKEGEVLLRGRVIEPRSANTVPKKHQ